VAIALVIGGCAPALDWREVRPSEAGVVLMFPCKPASHARRVRLLHAMVRLELHACTTAGATWALAFADVDEPAQVGPALDELRQAAIANLAATVGRERALQVPGATPNPASRQVDLKGRGPDGRALTERLALFAKGLRIYQATVLGERIDIEAAETFFDSLRLPA
jgi:hypothetical protein